MDGTTLLNTSRTHKKSIIIIQFIIPLAVILTYVLWHIELNSCPKILADEWGYWAGGAFFAGFDWSQVKNVFPYYGYGYGFILSILLKLHISMTLKYKIALLVNGGLVYLIYCAALFLYKEMSFCKENYIIRSLLAFFTAISPMTLYYTQYTLSEVALGFSFFGLILLIWEYINKQSYWVIAGLAAISFLCAAIHLRMIACPVISFVLCVLFLNRDSNYKKKVMCLLLAFTASAMLFIVIKRLYTSQGYIATDAMQVNSDNDISGRISQLSKFQTYEGWVGTTRNFAGRLFNLIVSGYLFPLVSIIECVKVLIKSIKTKSIHDISKIDILNVFCVLNAICVVIISSIAWTYGFDDRLDGLTCARYHAFIVSPLLFMGIYYTFNQAGIISSGKYLGYVLIISFLLGLYISSLVNYSDRQTNVFVTDNWLYFLISVGTNIRYVFYAHTLLASFIFLLFVYCKNNKAYVLVWTLLNIFLVIGVSKYTYVNGCESWSPKEMQNVSEMADYIENTCGEQPLYYLNSGEPCYIAALQFFLGRKTVNVITPDSYINVDFIITDKKSRSSDLLPSGYVRIFEGIQLELWRESKADNG